MNARVAVVGGGYAGTMIAKELDGEADVILIDPRDAFVNVSSSMRAAVRTEWASRPFFSYDALLEHGRVVRGAVTAVDPAGVTMAGGGRIEADYIVLATGSSHSYPARPRELNTSAADAANDLIATSAQLERSGSVLILGAGAVGLELGGEIREAWPSMRITIVAPSSDILPGYLPEVRDELRRQLQELRIDLRLNTSLASMPPVEDGRHSSFTVTTTTGEEIGADIWFRTFGARPNTGYLEDGNLITLTDRRTVPVDNHLNVVGYDNVYAVGDIADLTDSKMATWAQTQAPTVIENIRSHLRGERPERVYEPATTARILLPLGTRGGVGQLPGHDGAPASAPLEAVIARKGNDLFTARFAERFTRTSS
ncbi:MAG: FAD-dependent oxidoreductase [Subtercola sp.]|nr:FAD-dependent oxidoreductase [Subtercola sp.]